MGRTILLVEEEGVRAGAEARELEAAGLRVLSAPGGEAANYILRDRGAEVGLVLMDLVLARDPRGAEAARLAGAGGRALLFLFDEAEEGELDAALEAGARGFVSRAAGPAVLVASVRGALGRARVGGEGAGDTGMAEPRARLPGKEAAAARGENLAAPARAAAFGAAAGAPTGAAAMAAGTAGSGAAAAGAMAAAAAGAPTGAAALGATTGAAAAGPGGTGAEAGEPEAGGACSGMEAALAASEDRYRFLVERSPVGIGIFAEGAFTYANPAALRLAGVSTEEEIIGREVLSFVSPEQRAKVADFMRRLDEGEEIPAFETRIERKDGSEVAVRVAAAATLFEGRPAGLVIVRDETNQRGAREEIERRERELRVLTDCVPVRLAIVGAEDLRYRFANKTFVKTHGIPRDLLVGMEVREVIGEEAFAMAGPGIEAVLRGEINVHENIVRGPGGEQWSEVTLVPVPDEDDRIDRFVVLGVDITERRRTARMLEGLLEEKNLILREVHHRLKNNLAVVAGMLEQQAEEAGEEAAAVLRDAAARVTSTGYLYDRLYRAEDVRSLKAGDFLPDLVREIIGILPATRRIELRTAFDDFELPEKTLSPLGIIVNEFVTNSYKYAFPDRRAGTISLEGRLREGRVRLVYEDDGVGLAGAAAALGDHEGFGMRLVSILTAQIGGGLSIGGGKGARFILDFPLRP